MKKIFLGLFVILLTACSFGMNNTPKAKVKELLDRYKNQDSSVITNLEDVIDDEYSGEYKDRYKTLMLNQYKNLEYKITDEIIDGDTAIVTVDVTVYDFGSAIDAANTYLDEHEKEFYKKTVKSDELTEGENIENEAKTTIDYDKFLDYKLNLLESVVDRKTYSIDFTLTKEKDDWILDNLTDESIKKLHGLYTE